MHFLAPLAFTFAATIPVVIIGQPKAVANREGLLLTILNEVEVECLPTDLPDKIEMDCFSYLVKNLIGCNQRKIRKHDFYNRVHP